MQALAESKAAEEDDKIVLLTSEARNARRAEQRARQELAELADKVARQQAATSVLAMSDMSRPAQELHYPSAPAPLPPTELAKACLDADGAEPGDSGGGSGRAQVSGQQSPSQVAGQQSHAHADGVPAPPVGTAGQMDAYPSSSLSDPREVGCVPPSDLEPEYAGCGAATPVASNEVGVANVACTTSPQGQREDQERVVRLRSQSDLAEDIQVHSPSL